MIGKEKEISNIAVSPSLKRDLKARARVLEARLRIGKSGLSENLHGEISTAFQGKQLLKLRLERSAESTAKVIISQIESQHSCVLIQKVGRVATFYRPSDPVGKEQA